LIGFGLAAWAIFRQSPGASELKKKYDDLAGQIRKRAEELQTSAPIDKAHQLKFDASTYVDQYKRLSASYKNAQADYDAGRRQKQLDDHLNNFFIRNAKIDGINSGNIASLNSYGFFTAYDVKKRDVQTVHGIGPVKKSNIMAWLRRCEAKFAYSPVYTQVDQQNIKAGQAKIIDAQKATEDKLREVVTALQTDAAKYETWKKSTEAQLLPLMRQIAQVQVDLEHLGLPVTGIGQIRPYIVPVNTTYRPSGYSSYGASTTTATVGRASTASPSPTPTCPMCNRLMVKRTARQGRNRGGQFWGCSNFPRCTGTRPI
jgi:hypothetical protein